MPSNNGTQKLKDKAIDLRSKGLTTKEIAGAIGRDVSAIYRWTHEDDVFSARWSEVNDAALESRADDALATLISSFKAQTINLNDEVTTYKDENGNITGTVTKTKQVYKPADTKAAMFFLRTVKGEIFDKIAMQHLAQNNERLELEKAKLAKADDIKSSLDEVFKQYDQNDTL